MPKTFVSNFTNDSSCNKSFSEIISLLHQLSWSQIIFSSVDFSFVCSAAVCWLPVYSKKHFVRIFSEFAKRNFSGNGCDTMYMLFFLHLSVIFWSLLSNTGILLLRFSWHKFKHLHFHFWAEWIYRHFLFGWYDHLHCAYLTEPRIYRFFSRLMSFQFPNFDGMWPLYYKYM